MGLVRWDPIREVANLQRSISQLFDTLPTGRRSVGFPVDVYEAPDHFIVRADLPGVHPDDVQVQLHEGQLYVRATRRNETPQDATALVLETPEGEFVRGIGLATPIDENGVEARYVDGVLEVRLPKTPAARPKQIQVQAGQRAARRVRRAEGEPGAAESA